MTHCGVCFLKRAACNLKQHICSEPNQEEEWHSSSVEERLELPRWTRAHLKIHFFTLYGPKLTTLQHIFLPGLPPLCITLWLGLIWSVWQSITQKTLSCKHNWMDLTCDGTLGDRFILQAIALMNSYSSQGHWIPCSWVHIFHKNQTSWSGHSTWIKQLVSM